MIGDSLRVLLFGMLGIFLVMAIIYAVIVALSRISRRIGTGGTTGDELEESIDIAGEAPLSEEYVEYENYDEGDYVVEEGYVGGDGYVVEGEYADGDEYLVEEYEVVEA